MELFRATNFDFLKYKWYALVFSWLLIAVGGFAIFVQKGLRFGIDFAGGTQIALRFAQPPDLDRLREIMREAAVGDSGIQRFEEASKNQVLIRVQQQAGEGRDTTGEILQHLRQGLRGTEDPARIDINTEGAETLAARLAAADPERVAGRPDVTPETYYQGVAARIIAQRSQLGIFRAPAEIEAVAGVSDVVKQWLKANTYSGPFVLLSAESVGPQVGADLRKKAVLAVIWSIVGMLAYIAIRFRSLPFGVGAVVALIHDTLITVGLLALLGREFNLVVVAALLTLVGYSVNDTVVVYDRVRENQRSPKKESLEAVINRSINQTLSRTFLTAGATLLVCVALYFLGGEVLNTFALTLIIGILIGTYSSVYVAAAIVVIWKNWTGRRKLAAVPVAPARPTAPPAPPAATAGKKKKSGRR